MKKLLLAATALLFVSSANAAVIKNLGTDPTSAAGDFSNSVGGTTFDDQYPFDLSKMESLTIASVTNVFPGITDFITNFTGSVFFDPLGGNDPLGPGVMQVIGPVAATACNVPQCQGFAGEAILNQGHYFLDISGIGGGTSGYGGNLSTFAVPGPIVGAGIPGLLSALGFGGLWWRSRKKVA